MTRMERRRRRRRIARIRFVTTVLVLVAVGCTMMTLTSVGGADGSEAEPLKSAQLAAIPAVTLENRTTEAPVLEETAFIEAVEEPAEEDENELIEQALLEQNYLHEEIPLDYDLQCHLLTVCEKYGVPAHIALGVIQAESSFRADAQNGNCYGYMQINSINESWLAERIGVTNLTEPYQNIRSGVYILSDLYSKQGDWHRALICYNYGESGAQKHVFSQGYTTTVYSRTVMGYAAEWEAVLK